MRLFLTGLYFLLLNHELFNHIALLSVIYSTESPVFYLELIHFVPFSIPLSLHFSLLLHVSSFMDQQQ